MRLISEESELIDGLEVAQRLGVMRARESKQVLLVGFSFHSDAITQHGSIIVVDRAPEACHVLLSDTRIIDCTVGGVLELIVPLINEALGTEREHPLKALRGACGAFFATMIWALALIGSREVAAPWIFALAIILWASTIVLAGDAYAARSHPRPWRRALIEVGGLGLALFLIAAAIARLEG